MFLVGVEFFSRELRDEILRKAYISSRTEFQNIDIFASLNLSLLSYTHLNLKLLI